MSANKIPKCPNCNKQMVAIWYHEPDETFEKFINEHIKKKEIFYRGLEYKPTRDFEDPKRISYHCYNCNRSYTRDLTKYEEEEYSEKIMIQAKNELFELVDYLAREVIKELKEDTI